MYEWYDRSSPHALNRFVMWSRNNIWKVFDRRESHFSVFVGPLKGH